MSENKKNISRESIGLASNDAPLRESLNAPSRQFNGSQDAPNPSSKGKQVSYKITANDSQ
jgi:hypothetical protein